MASIDSFFASTTIPADTSLWIQFATSSDSGPWYDASGALNATTSLVNGTSTIDLSGLSWSGPNFYYKIQFNSNPAGDATPLLDEIQVEYTPNSPPDAPTSLGQYKSDCSTAISTGGWTNETEVCFKATISDIDASDPVKIQVEIATSTDSFSDSPTHTAASLCISTCTSTTSASGLTNATQYKWQARSIDDDSATSSWSQFNSGNLAFGIDTSAPASVSIVSLAADSSSQITVTVSAEDASSGLASEPYWVEETSGNSGGSSSADWQAATTFTDDGLSLNEQYIYKVKARDAVSNQSNFSATSSIYTLANVPADLSLSAGSQTQIIASWNGNSNPSATEYLVENTTAGTDSGWTTSLTWTSDNLNCGQSYSFKVKARNNDLVETDYAEASQSTQACPALYPGGYLLLMPPLEGFGILINNNALVTNSRSVVLTLRGGPNIARMVISNFSDLRNASQETYKTAKIWDLCQGLASCSEGRYTVYAKFFAFWGAASETVSDSIIYQRITAGGEIEQEEIIEEEIPLPVEEPPAEEVISPPKEIIPPSEETPEETLKTGLIKTLKEFGKQFWQRISDFCRKIWPF